MRSLACNYIGSNTTYNELFLLFTGDENWSFLSDISRNKAGNPTLARQSILSPTLALVFLKSSSIPIGAKHNL